MNHFDTLQQIFRRVFQENALILTRALEAKDITMWDSLTHLELIVEIENTFGIQIPFEQVTTFQNAGDLIDCVTELTQ